MALRLRAVDVERTVWTNFACIVPFDVRARALKVTILNGLGLRSECVTRNVAVAYEERAHFGWVGIRTWSTEQRWNGEGYLLSS